MVDYEYIKQTFTLADHCSTGVACLLSVNRFYGGKPEIWVLERWSDVKNGTVSLKGLKNAFVRSGFNCQVMQMTLEKLRCIYTPTILFFDTEQGKKDFVVYYGFDGDRFIVGDTSWGLMQYWPDEMDLMWIKGICMMVFPDDTFEREEDQEKRINRYIRFYLKSDWKYFIVFLCGIVLAIGVAWGIWFWYSNFFMLLGFLLLICGGYYIFSVAYLKWKQFVAERFNRFWRIMMNRVNYGEQAQLYFAMEKYPQMVIKIFLAFVLYLGGISYTLYQSSFLLLVYVLYIPLTIYGIWQYRSRQELHFSGKSSLELEFIEEVKKIVGLRVKTLLLLNAGLAGWMCWPNGWLGMFTAMISLLVTNILYQYHSIKSTVPIFLSVYMAYRRRERYE
ncbi:hypothetical protein H8784_10915 [Parabacteroides acidifaciens]|uniref:Peptidase C39 domain-containing protein n=1 Tax=Parabacteroides acidifaciens TaxID=2290935 RepID=A0A3D8HEN9_9BACT|nr:cysteine peptidase family C39 domain-containing protein [Parabacteroides acidifaciens]MBC8602224.1 hypothetical protein [Parabacteroides acidifaciens]RDU49037.1 hypothetical protein DWU89_11200 [Parabacteroides acidifaciens]